MAYTTILYFVMIAVFVGYVSWIWARYGILTYISDSYYQLPKNLQILFTLFCWGFCFPAAILGECGWMMLAAAGIGFVGAAAAFQEKMTGTVHDIGAAVSVIASQLAIGLVWHLWPINIAFVTLSLLIFLFRKKLNYNHMWWIEILAFLSICIALGIKLF